MACDDQGGPSRYLGSEREVQYCACLRLFEGARCVPVTGTREGWLEAL